MGKKPLKIFVSDSVRVGEQVLVRLTKNWKLLILIFSLVVVMNAISEFLEVRWMRFVLISGIALVLVWLVEYLKPWWGNNK